MQIVSFNWFLSQWQKSEKCIFSKSNMSSAFFYFRIYGPYHKQNAYTLGPTNYQFVWHCGTNGEFFGLVNEFSACWNKSIKSQKQTIVRWHSHLRSKSHCYVREFKMTSFIGPYVEIIRVVFLAFLHPFIEMHLSRQRRILKWEKKGFKVSNLTMKTVPTNRYDIIMDGIIMEEW